MENCSKISDRNWELLLEAIDGKRVIPIIGDDFFYLIDENGVEVSVRDYLIQQLAIKFNVKGSCSDFSSIADAIDVENLTNWKIRYINTQTDIYYEIHQLLQSKTILVRDSLHKLLSLNKFPLILTTSFIPGLEDILSENGCDCISISYDKSADSDLSPQFNTNAKTTLYYLFGRCSKIRKSYMVTEEDLLEYMHLWHEQDARPPKLSRYLANRFLMVLGCNYPNWLFRFFWHSIRNFALSPSITKEDKILETMQAVVSIDKIKEDADLYRFLSRIHTSVYGNSQEFIDELAEQWEAYEKDRNDTTTVETETQSPISDSNDLDIFISYAHEDRTIARQLSDLLEKLGAKVWFDDRELVLSEKYEPEITAAIGKAKRFMPILSSTTMKQEPSFFRKEWAIAHRVMDDRFGMPFFAPVIIDDSDPNDDRILQTFRDCHIISFRSDDVEHQFKKFIRSLR